MKTLFLARHAKSSWDLPEVEDLDRPLIEKGLIKTQKTIDFLLKHDVYVDLLISSHAKRALETAKLYAKALKYPIQKIEVNTAVYYTSPEILFSVLYAIPDEVQSAMLVGHNPAMTQFVNCFADQLIEYLPTSGVVAFEFDTKKWADIELSRPKTKYIIFPKKL
jgi:phosphohistidine phosphatase